MTDKIMVASDTRLYVVRPNADVEWFDRADTKAAA